MIDFFYHCYFSLTTLCSDIYNALTIHGLSEREKLPDSVLNVQLFWKTTAYNIGGQTYSLDDIEHGILRGECYNFYNLCNFRNFLISTNLQLQQLSNSHNFTQLPHLSRFPQQGFWGVF